MATRFLPARLPGVILCRPEAHSDPRGLFTELYRRDRYAANGVDRVFVQMNQSHSRGGVLRGMHYQLRRPQAKLISVVAGRVADVVVDLRRSSPSFRQWERFDLSAEGAEQLFVPEGFAHGFCVVSGSAQVIYQCSDYYVPDDQCGFRWDSLGIDWPVRNPEVSDKDGALPAFDSLPPDQLPRMEGS